MVGMGKWYAPRWEFLDWYVYEAMLHNLDGWRGRCERQGLLEKEKGRV
jgi:hypothetical protein